jgi:hypothetical protein
VPLIVCAAFVCFLQRDSERMTFSAAVQMSFAKGGDRDRPK